MAVNCKVHLHRSNVYALCTFFSTLSGTHDVSSTYFIAQIGFHFQSEDDLAHEERPGDAGHRSLPQLTEIAGLFRYRTQYNPSLVGAVYCSH